jgi:Flp pilus assembly protein TadG
MRYYPVIPSALARRLADFLADRRGLSAVEFALLLPLMLTLYLGGVEVSNGVALDRKVAITARTVADLASRMTSINNSAMTNILGASAAVVAPYPASQSVLSVTVSEVSIDSKGAATITWSDALYSGSAHTVGQTITIPSQLAVPNTSLILGEVQYKYDPTFGYVLTGTMTLKSQMYMVPRLSSTVQRVNS